MREIQTRLVTQGQIENTFYIVVEGQVAIVQNLENGEERLLAVVGPRQYFGELGLLDDTPRMANCVTITPVKVLEITSEASSQILAFTGASAGLAGFATTLPVSPMFIIILMQVIILFLGCLMDVVSIMMITLPIFVPVVRQLGYNDVWFAVTYLINIEIAGISPPFGLSLFVMKGVASKGTTQWATPTGRPCPSSLAVWRR